MRRSKESYFFGCSQTSPRMCHHRSAIASYRPDPQRTHSNVTTPACLALLTGSVRYPALAVPLPKISNSGTRLIDDNPATAYGQAMGSPYVPWCPASHTAPHRRTIAKTQQKQTNGSLCLLTFVPRIVWRRCRDNHHLARPCARACPWGG